MAAKTKFKNKSLTKSQVVTDVAQKSGLSKKDVNAAFDALTDILAKEVKGRRPISVLGLVKVTTVHKDATPSRPGRNPFNGESIMIKAKPARSVVKVRALKALKDMI
jgi:nucleoid DNA-binding protein